MTHLSDIELVDLVEGALPRARAAHVEECGRCRTKADELRATLSRASEADVPEPSPLFWEHLSRRVHEGLREEGPRLPDRNPGRGWFVWPQQLGTLRMAAAALALVVLIGVAWGVYMPAPRQPSNPPAGPAVVRSAGDDLDPAETLDPNADPAWAVVRALADDVAWDDALEAGLGARPDAAERAVRSLTNDERSELMRLLEAETKRKGA